MKKFIVLISFSLLFTAGYATKPNLSFFCELPEQEFNDLFADTSLIRELIDMNISLRIGLHDFRDERTRTIQKLNKAGVPLVAWLLLPEEDGYWFNMHNGEKAEKRYDDFVLWTANNNLKWEAIGIDIELDMNDAKLAISHPWKLAWKVYKRLYDNKSLKKGKEQYQKLISRMRDDGYKVESYIIPFVYEERLKGLTSFQKLMGIVDIETDSEIPMLYTSAMGNPGIISIYCTDGNPVALGSTGGGVNIEGIELQSLKWDQLKRDLLIASKLTDEIHIFCLETSVQKGYLDSIRNLDFTQEAPDISLEIEKQKKMNGIIHFILFILNYPLLLTIVILTLITVIIFGFYKLFLFLMRLFISKKVS